MLTIRECLERFYDEIWKEGKPFIGDFEGVPILQDALASLSGHSFVLVREEYARVWEQVQSLRDDAVAAGQTMQEGLIVIGHHGIGMWYVFLSSVISSLTLICTSQASRSSCITP